jgi:hypothetical protein
MASQIQTTGCTAAKKARSPHQATGTWCRADLRLAVYLRDSFRCLGCCADLHGADPRDVTLDHITPKADGGSNEPGNLYTCCRTCNCRRQDTSLKRFYGPETVADIRTHARRPIARFRKLAKAILAGEVGFEETFKSGL